MWPSEPVGLQTAATSPRKPLGSTCRSIFVSDVERPGRRTTARPPLDEYSNRAPSGRLLDVGCGHGLLLDEARRLGYEVEGLELAEDAAAHARDQLHLTVHAKTLAELPGPPRYNAIVLA